MKLLVCGGRDFEDDIFMYEELNLFKMAYGVDILIEGGAPGADRIARDWAHWHGIHVATVEALWHLYPKGKGNPAGPKRNVAMMYLQPDYVIAFAGNNGTAHMISLCKAQNVIGRHYVPTKNGYRLDAF